RATPSRRHPRQVPLQPPAAADRGAALAREPGRPPAGPEARRRRPPGGDRGRLRPRALGPGPGFPARPYPLSRGLQGWRRATTLTSRATSFFTFTTPPTETGLIP